jgi:ligand-binding SRPBCC domain-containing protein
MDYRHSFTVRASLADVRQFHSRSASMSAITPPPVFARIHQAPEVLGEGDDMAFTLWMGPLPVRWKARIENVTPQSFDDRQLTGPFNSWVHHHTFVPLEDGRVEVQDWVQAELSDNLFWHIFGIFMWVNMSVLFTYRAWRTRFYLEAKPG